MSQSTQPGLPPDAVEKIEEHREALKRIVADDGEFSATAQKILELADGEGGA